MTSIRESRMERWHKLLKPRTSAKPPSRKPMPPEQETANPLPDNDYTRKQRPFADDEENSPAQEGP